MAKIVSLDDNKHCRLLIETVLGAHGHAVTTVASWADLAPTIRTVEPDLLLLDLNMPLPGENVGAVVRKVYRDIPIVFVSGEKDERLLAAVETMGAAGFVRKDASLRSRLPEVVSEVLAGQDLPT